MFNVSDFPMQTQQIMGLSMIPFALMGFICNWMIVYVIFRTPSAQHSFTVLTANQAFFEGCHSTIYLFYVTPMIVFDLDYLKINSYHAGWLILLFYDASMQIHFVMTINRFVAVYTPFLFPKLFSKKNTRIVCIVSFAISASVITLFFRFLGCRMTYLNDFWMFEYSMQPICQSYMYFNDISKVSMMAIANIIIDTVTISKVIYGRKRLRKNSMAAPNAAPLMRKKEVDFLKQSFGQGLALFLGLSIYIFAPELVSDPMRAFLVSTLFWCALHAFDGSITLYYNSDIQKALKKLINGKTGQALLVAPAKSMTSVSKY